MEFLRTENIVKQYANHLALDSVNIEVSEGRIFGLLGPNGAGKTTLIRIINNITAPDSGMVYLEGKPLQQAHTNIIGYLPEERGLYKKMKVGEQALYLARLKGLSKIEALKKLKFWFEKFEIQTWWEKKVEELSKGMQQKIQFITTVLHEPKLLIFDEPFSGFDPINAELMKQEILQLRNSGATIVFSTHNMSSVEEICDDIALINNSKTILKGTISEIKNRYKTNTFEICFKDNFPLNIQLPENQFIIEEQIAEENLLKVKIQDDIHTNDLLMQLMKFGTISSFNEIIPSMNEVFIRTVNQSNR